MTCKMIDATYSDPKRFPAADAKPAPAAPVAADAAPVAAPPVPPASSAPGAHDNKAK